MAHFWLNSRKAVGAGGGQTEEGPPVSVGAEEGGGGEGSIAPYGEK